MKIHVTVLPLWDLPDGEASNEERLGGEGL